MIKLFATLTVGITIGALSSLCFAADQTKICAKQHCISVEIAQSEAELALGLMNHKKLNSNKGMIFIFKESALHHFWMKNMKFPLDLLWLDHQGNIVDMKENVPPCDSLSCPTIFAHEDAQYVLEINAGMAKRFGWKVQDKLILKGMPTTNLKNI